jgi:fructokinase
MDRIYTDSHQSPVEALGGSCANVLISLAMLGHRVSPILTLGADDIGRRLFNEMRRAGCATKHVFREADTESPVTVEFLDTAFARHSFSSTCPETDRPFASYRPLEASRAKQAERTIRASALFYVDRLTPTTLQVMEEASASGAIVYFEPNAIKDVALFRRAVKFVDVLKISADVGRDLEFAAGEAPPYLIVTHGRSGLSLMAAKQNLSFPGFTAPRLVDTCGSGDMVTTGLIHMLMRREARHHAIELSDVCNGLIVGQWLAAQNCAFIGARGLFHAFGAEMIRDALQSVPSMPLNVAQFAPHAGY